MGTVAPRLPHLGFKDDAEFRITCSVAAQLEFRALPGLVWTHLPFGEARSERTGSRLKRMGTKKGQPDFLLLWKGRAIGLELKTEKGRMTPEQVQAREEWTTAGAVYFCAKGFRAAIEFLETLGVLKPDRSLTRHQPEVRT